MKTRNWHQRNSCGGIW